VAEAVAKRTVFRREGEFWTIGFQNSLFRLRDRKGLACIGFLLRYPDREFHAIELGNLVEGGPEVGASAASSADGSAPGIDGDAGEILDAAAKADYKRRIDQLREKAEERREFGDTEGAARADEEIDFLARELRQALGLGGRARRASSNNERARVRITGLIKLAIKKISEEDQTLGQLLARSIKTGIFCSYNAVRAAEIAWSFETEQLETNRSDAASQPALEVRPERQPGPAPTFLYQTNFVNSETERASLHASLQRTMAGHGAIVMLGGEPGVGKTRLASELAREAWQSGVEVLVGHCAEREQAVPLLPFAEILESAMARAPGHQALSRSLGEYASELSRLLPQLRRVFPDIAPPQELPPEQSRRAIFNAFNGLLADWSHETPLMLLLDDLHDADESTLLLLSVMARKIAEIKVLVVGTHRDAEVDMSPALARTLEDLARSPSAGLIKLNPLPRERVADLLSTLSGRLAPEKVVDGFFEETDGNPFFVEELFRHLLEQGTLLAPDGEFRRRLVVSETDAPRAVRLVIERRLDHLQAGTRMMLSSAAVIGRVFSFKLWRAVTGAESDELIDCIEEAERSGLIFSDADSGEERFAFAHELIRQVIIAGTSLPRRQRFHLRVADAIQALFADRLDDHADHLAHHLLAAGDLADPYRTVTWLAVAAKRDRERSAYDMALARLQNGLELIRKGPESAERDERELSLLNDFALAAMAAKGYAAPEVASAYSRAWELCKSESASKERFRTLLGLCAFYFVRADFLASREAAAKALAQAETSGDPAMLGRACHVMGCALEYCGEIRDALAYLEKGLRLCDPEGHAAITILYEHDPRVTIRTAIGWALLLLGYPDRALEVTREALGLARDSSHPFSVAFALSFLVRQHFYRKEWTAGHDRAAELIELGTEQGLPLFVTGSRLLQSWALAEQGHSDEAFARVFQELPSWQSMGSGPESLAIVGGVRIFELANQKAPALQMLLAGMAQCHARGDHLHDAELLRLKGELLLELDANLGGPQAAERCFNDALEIARRQGAKLFELRTAISLSRYWRTQGKTADAQQLLESVYGKFTEGLDLLDLQEAKTLLAELS
jgi:tetratricopeptide (TPR) repeat protein